MRHVINRRNSYQNVSAFAFGFYRFALFSSWRIVTKPYEITSSWVVFYELPQTIGARKLAWHDWFCRKQMSLGCSPGFLLYQTFRLTGAKKAQELNDGGFLRTRRGSVFLRNFEASVFLRVFDHACIRVHARLRPAAVAPSAAPPSAAARAHAPYSLYIRPHGLHHNAIVNAAAGVANPARVSYIESAITRFGDANAR
jgi:hypothetical protein